jgi:proteasome lid subunit RPN8/RPN11
MGYSCSCSKSRVYRQVQHIYPEELRVRIFPVALGKIIYHASSNPSVEVAGLLLGKESRGAVEVWDAVTGPQEGHAGYVKLNEEVMAMVAEKLFALGLDVYIVGWYHSHPGYGLFLSAVDVRTQLAYQALYSKSIALVIDPSKFLQTGDISNIAFKVFRIDGEAGVVEVPTSIGMDRRKVLESTLAALKGLNIENTFLLERPPLVFGRARQALADVSKKIFRREVVRRNE